VDDDRPRASLGERFNLKRFRALDHEVHLKVEPHISQRLADLWPHREWRNELAVHHVDVDNPGAGVFDELYLLAQNAEVSGQNRGRNLNVHSQTSTNIEVPQCEHSVVAVLDIRTIVWCSPQPGHTERSS